MSGCYHLSYFQIWTTSNLRIVAVAVAKGVPFKVGVSIVGGERMDDVWAVIVNATTFVGLLEFAWGGNHTHKMPKHLLQYDNYT